MTPEQLAEIEERVKNAAPGPWYERGSADGGEVVDAEGDEVAFAHLMGYAEFGRNRDFVTHSRQDIPALLAYVQSLQAELEQLRTIFSRDMLEDDAAIREAYERGKMDAAREMAEAAELEMTRVRSRVTNYPGSALSPTP